MRWLHCTKCKCMAIVLYSLKLFVQQGGIKSSSSCSQKDSQQMDSSRMSTVAAAWAGANLLLVSVSMLWRQSHSTIRQSAATRCGCKASSCQAKLWWCGSSKPCCCLAIAAGLTNGSRLLQPAGCAVPLRRLGTAAARELSVCG